MMLATALLLLVPAADAGPLPIEPREGIAAVDAVPGDAGGLVLRASVEPSVATFGEPFALVITVERERGVRLVMPGSLPDIEGAPRMWAGGALAGGALAGSALAGSALAGSALAGSALAGSALAGSALAGSGAPTEARSVIELPQTNGAPQRVRETIRIAYLCLDTIELKTPAFSLTTKDGVTLEVPSLSVKVIVLPEPPDAGPAVTKEGAVVLEPAAGTIAYPVPDTRPFIALASLLAAGLLYAAARTIARRRRLRPAPLVPLPPPRPAHEVALERLEALLRSGLLARGETAVFVERLMDEVLRDYVTARFSLSAGTRTTRELVKDLLGVSVPGLDVALVETLLIDTDLVKFAKATIAADRAHAMATRVRALVEATRDRTDSATRQASA